MRSLPHGCTLVTIRKRLAELESIELVHLEELQLPMSWGLASVFVAERRREETSRSPLAIVLDLDAMD